MESLPVQLERDTVRDLLALCNDSRGVVIERFIDAMHNLVFAIHQERVEQGLQPYTADELRTLLHAAVGAATTHFGQERLSGESVFEVHLHGGVNEVVRLLGRTRLSVLCAIYFHDSKEDRGVAGFSAFDAIWRLTFRDQNDPLIDETKALRRRVWKLVGGATQGQEKDRGQREAAQVRKSLGAIAAHGWDYFHVKFGGDGLTNLQTMESQREERRKPLCRRYYEVDCRLAEIAGLRDAVRVAVNCCAAFLNPDILRHFEQVRDERMVARLDRPIKPIKRRREQAEETHQAGQTETVKQFLLKIFNQEGREGEDGVCVRKIRRIVFDQAQLADFVLKHEESLEDLTIEDLRISSLNPLFEVVIIVEPGTDHSEIAKYIKKHCLGEKERSEFHEQDPSEQPKRGSRLTLYSQRLGTLKFRINDSISEARAKRGILLPESAGPAEVDAAQKELTAAVHRVIEETREDVLLTVPLARERLLNPKITVYTPRNEPILLPKGATAFDFAAVIHTRFLRRAPRAIWHKSDTEWEEICPFKPLKDGMKLELVEEQNTEVASPGWLYFCKTETARRILKKRILKADNEAMVVRGQQYMGRISRLFGVSARLILREIKRRSKAEKPRESEAAEEDIYSEIASGSLDLLQVIGEAFFRGMNTWPIRVMLRHEPKVLHRFTDEIGDQEINIDGLVHIPRPAPKTHIVRMKLEDYTGEKKPTDMMKILLRLSYEYDLTMVHSDMMRRVGTRIADTFRLAWHILNRPVFSPKEAAKVKQSA